MAGPPWGGAHLVANDLFQCPRSLLPMPTSSSCVCQVAPASEVWQGGKVGVWGHRLAVIQTYVAHSLA